MYTLEEIRIELRILYPKYIHLKNEFSKNPSQMEIYKEYQNLIGQISYLEYKLIRKLIDPDDYLRDD